MACVPRRTCFPDSLTRAGQQMVPYPQRIPAPIVPTGTSPTVALGRGPLTLGCILKYLLVSKLFFSLSE